MTHALSIREMDGKLLHCLQQARMDSGLTVAELAARTGLAPVVLLRMEAGLVSLTPATAYTLGSALGVDIVSALAHTATATAPAMDQPGMDTAYQVAASA